ncbi:MAG: hypothetical protein V4671_01970 [Armatimonadota bacterium]
MTSLKSITAVLAVSAISFGAAAMTTTATTLSSTTAPAQRPQIPQTLMSTPRVKPKPEALTKWEAQSVSLMSRGRRLKAAATDLAAMVRREPLNPRYAVLLACALAERAYVLAEAVAEIREAAASAAFHQRRLTYSEASQQDPENPLFGKPKPEILLQTNLVPRTRDDNKPLTMTEAAACTRIQELSESALRLLTNAAHLSGKEDLQVQAENAFLSGWTTLVLWHLPRKIVPQSWPEKDLWRA